MPATPQHRARPSHPRQALALPWLALAAIALVGCGDRKPITHRSVPDAEVIPEVISDAGNDHDRTENPDAGAPPKASNTQPPTLSFVVHNLTDRTVHYEEDCTVRFRILKATSHTEVFFNLSTCACDCASATCDGQLACGACPQPDGRGLEPGKTLTLTWLATTRSEETRTGSRGSFACIRRTPLPPGNYLFALDLYPTAADVALPTKATRLEHPFTLANVDATIEIPISQTVGAR